MQQYTLGLILVGDELLSGRRQDRHLAHFCQLLPTRGIDLAWCWILPDDPGILTRQLRWSMEQGIPVLCCGGIGATPDDHTRASAAAAAGVKLVRHPKAVALIEQRFGQAAYPHRVRMAELPEGCTLIPNPYNQIPGFQIKDHHFLPGFTEMAWPMGDWVLANRFPDRGLPPKYLGVRVLGVAENALVPLLEQWSRDYPQLKISSLPRLEPRAVEVGVTGNDHALVERAFATLQTSLETAQLPFELMQEPPQ